MLTRFHKILIALLAVQLILAVIVLTRGDDSAALKEHPVVTGFDAAKVTKLQVFAGDAGKPAAETTPSKPVELVKRDTSWVLASGFDYPVDQAKVTDVLSQVGKLSAAAPIATQASRHKQLHVADGDFDRKLVITSGGKDLVVYIGGPAGARRTAVRIGGDDKVYAVAGISASTAGSEPRQWIDPSYVKIPREDIAKVVVQRDGRAVELSRTAPTASAAGSGAGSGSAGGGSGAGSGSAGSGSAGGGSAGSGSGIVPAPPAADHWYVTIAGAPIALAAGESIDEAAIDRLVNEVAVLDLSAPADPKRDASRPTATITVERKATGSSTPAPTVLDVIADGTSYWVHDRSLPRAALVDKSRLDELVGVDRDKVVKKPPPPPTPPGAPGAGSGSATGTAVRPPPGGPGHPPAAAPGHPPAAAAGRPGAGSATGAH